MNAPPPPDELRALVALEKDALVDPGPARARLLARLAPELSAPPPPPPPKASPPAPSRWWRRGIATGLGGFGAGVVATSVIRSLVAPAAPPVEIRYVDRVVEVERIVDAAAPPPTPSSPPSASASLPAPPPSRPDRPAAPAASTDEALARERQVIEKARSALARHDADAALAAVGEHAKAFPRGQLVEMREAIAVQALVQAGRNAEARSRAGRFHTAFPASMYGPVVDNAISSIP